MAKWPSGCGLLQAGLHVVESITRTSEVIAAGNLGVKGEPILVHSKLHTQRGAADLLIKCNDNALAQAFVNHLKAVLQG
jgi:hypothetical protein